MEQRSSVRMMTVATALTIGGMCLAALDAFCLPGVWGPVGLAIVYVFGGGPASIRALTALWRERSLDIDLLMVIAAVAAAAVDAALEGAVLLTLFSISTTLEHRVMGRARRAVEALMSLRPDTALLRQPDGSVTEVPVRQLQPGDHMVLRPGAKVPVDGVIREGQVSIYV